MNPTDRNEILEMLASGKISASEAVNLLDNIGKRQTAEQVSGEGVIDLKEAEHLSFESELTVEEIKESAKKAEEPYQIKIMQDDTLLKKANGEKPRWLKIRVRNLETGKSKVSVTLPLGLVNFGLGVARHFGAEFDDDHNIHDMWQMVKEGERGVLVDVQDEEDNEHVQIYLD